MLRTDKQHEWVDMENIDPASRAILKPVLYADIFDFPLTAEEIYQFLECEASRGMVRSWLERAVAQKLLICKAGYYCLPDRVQLVAIRQERGRSALRLWSQAIDYGLWIATLPFVRMVAVTGALAVDNPRSATDDIDYLIVTQPRRLWLCRAMIIMVVRYGHRQGVHLCPNYLITENALGFDENLFAARELLQMRPIYGSALYGSVREHNRWVRRFFPQGDIPRLEKIDEGFSWPRRTLKKAGEFLFGGPAGDLLEDRLRRIQVAKHSRQARQHNSPDKMVFSADVCKGHYDGHEHRILNTYRQRVNGFIGHSSLVTGKLPVTNDKRPTMRASFKNGEKTGGTTPRAPRPTAFS